MPNIILERMYPIESGGKIRNVRCRVTGEPGVITSERLFILYFVGGPGFGSQYIMPIADEMAKLDDQRILSPYWIFFDYVGCGESDIPATEEEKNLEYEVNNYTLIGAQVTERVMVDLQLRNLNVSAYAASFGAMPAVNLLNIRPQWTEPDSPIRLRSICTEVGVTGYEHICSPQFVEEKYRDDPFWEEYYDAVSMVREGRIPEDENGRGYIKYILSKIAGTMSEENNKYPTRLFLKALGWFPVAAPKLLELINKVASSKKIDQILDYRKCNVSVMNTFFKNNSREDGFQLERIIPRLREIYARVPIFCLSSEMDCFAAPEGNSERLIPLLPDTLGQITVSGRHHDFKTFAAALPYHFFIGNVGELKRLCTEMPGAKINAFPPMFEKQLEQFRREVIEHEIPAGSSSTTDMFRSFSSTSEEVAGMGVYAQLQDDLEVGLPEVSVCSAFSIESDTESFLQPLFSQASRKKLVMDHQIEVAHQNLGEIDSTYSGLAGRRV